ncbi:MAG: tetratricopeptide repeat protein [Asticcacaulis sp.]
MMQKNVSGLLRLTILGGVAASTLVLAGCEGLTGASAGKSKESRLACPRPASLSGQSGFNDQEREIRHLRRLAFSNDFFAQLELGARYAANRSTDKNIEDAIESSVWLAMALANPEGYAPINRSVRQTGMWRSLSRYDDCRAWERQQAYTTLNTQLSKMSTLERQTVRDRVIYILSTLDADGYRTLARLYDNLYGPFGEPADNQQALAAMGDKRSGPKAKALSDATALFQRNDVDAYLYNYLAVQTGDVSAFVLLKDFERSAPERKEYGSFVEAKAKRWTPPFEFYPTQAPQGGVPHSDESRPRGDAYEIALSRIEELPFIHVGKALNYLDISIEPRDSAAKLTVQEIEALQAKLGRPMTGRLTNLEKVRAIQLAAINGSAQSQLVLAVMYAEGVGVPADYARAFAWFEEAERQGSPEAKFAMSTYFGLGVTGVADQDKAKAVVLKVESALGGFKPTVSRLQAILAQVSRSQRR